MKKLPPPDLPRWLALQLPFERYRLEIGEYQMHVMERGRGAPVLMLHGNPTWGFLWRKVAAELRGAPLRLVMPDLVGLGFSDKPRDLAWHTLERHAAQVARLVAALGLEQLVLVAHDWGGPIAGAALERLGRERMAGAVILNTALSPPRASARGKSFHRFARMRIISDVVFRVFGFPQSVLALAQGDRSSIRRDVARAYRFPLRGLQNNAAPLALARMVPDAPSHPSVAALERCRAFFEQFKGPAEIVWGERDPILGRALKRVEAVLPDAQVTRTQAGHFLQEEVPEVIAAAIRRVAGLD
ncbi:MAG TPA: alpha/beta fold hydrolase [Myxococcaceae bacterium]|nr:alpha/beta fold hydrolase [Myxococcaceae bacterium]